MLQTVHCLHCPSCPVGGRITLLWLIVRLYFQFCQKHWRAHHLSLRYRGSWSAQHDYLTVSTFCVEWPDVCSRWRPASGMISNWGVMKSVPLLCLSDTDTHIQCLCRSVCTPPKKWVCTHHRIFYQIKKALSLSWLGRYTHSVITVLMTFFHTHAGTIG